MDFKEAMRQRHMVRRYMDRPLPAETVKELDRYIDKMNQSYGLAVELKTEDSSAFNAVIKLVLAKGVRNFFVMAGKDAPDLDERRGYCGAGLMLYAQTLGLNTWWVGGTFNRKRMTEISHGNRVVGVVAVGYGQTQGSPHKTKGPEQAGSYSGDEPEWFRQGIEAALLAPTALAKQAFMITGSGNKVSIRCDNGIFSGVDTGLVKYHFELGAGKENFVWV